MLSEELLGGIMDPYRIHFKTNATFDGQMQAYYNYISALDPTITTANLFLYVVDCTTNTSATTSPPCLSSPLLPNYPVTVTWGAGTMGGSMNGQPLLGYYTAGGFPIAWNAINPGPIPPNNLHWAQIFGPPVVPSPLVINRRYMVIAIPVLWRQGIGFEWQVNCPGFIHQTNHMQSLKTGNTTIVSGNELSKSAVGQAILRELRKANAGGGSRGAALEGDSGELVADTAVRIYRPGESAPNDNDASLLNASQVVDDKTSEGSKH
jgi:hypothetical protein